VLAVAIIMWKVIPVFAGLFESMDAQLPLPTRIVITASSWFGRLLPLIVVVVVALVFAVRRYYATYSGRRVIDRFLLRLPILGILLRKVAVARFARTLATLTASGVPILDGLEITARTAGNAIVEDAIMVVRKGVEGGLTLAQPLKETNVFPSMVVQMIAVGEQTGALDAMLSKIADFYEEEVDQAVANLLTLMEPVMILVLGFTVGGIIISMYLPLFDLISKLAG
jgi:type IV pilus assembly protein PilC